MQKARSVLNFTSLVQYALLSVFLLVLICLAATGYAAAAGARSANNEARAQLAYMVNKVRAADAAGCVSVEALPEGDKLILTDVTESGSFETRFYVVNGRLLEEYSAADAPVSPERAAVIGETETLSAVLANGLLTLTTDCGTVSVTLRSAAQNGGGYGD